MHLDRFVQAYAVEMTKQLARRKGYQVSEQALDNGSIRVEIMEGLLTMTTPPRRIVRPIILPIQDHQRQRQLQKLRCRLEKERAALARWMSRLRRAFHAVERYQGVVTRLEKTFTLLEE